MQHFQYIRNQRKDNSSLSMNSSALFLLILFPQFLGREQGGKGGGEQGGRKG